MPGDIYPVIRPPRLPSLSNLEDRAYVVFLRRRAYPGDATSYCEGQSLRTFVGETTKGVSRTW